MNYPTDQEIIELLRDGGTTEAVQRMYLKYGTVMWNRIRRQLHKDLFSDEDVNDVLADTFSALLDLKNTYLAKLQQFEVQFEGSLGAWLADVSKYAALDWLKSRNRKSEQFVENDNEEDEEKIIESLPDADSTNKPFIIIFGEVVFKIIQELPEELRKVILLHAQGCEHGDIAEQLGISKGASRKRLERARRYLDARLIDEGYGDKKDHYAMFPFLWLFRRNLQEQAFSDLHSRPFEDTSNIRDLGDFIREKRYEKSFNRYQLSQKTGLTCEHLAALENGRILFEDIADEWLIKIADALDINLALLQGYLKKKNDVVQETNPRKDVRNVVLSAIVLVVILFLPVGSMLKNSSALTVITNEAATTTSTATTMILVVEETATPSPTPTVTPSKIPTNTPTPTETSTPTATNTATATPSPTATNTPTITPDRKV